jgi:fluoroquinolone resistance protein
MKIFRIKICPVLHFVYICTYRQSEEINPLFILFVRQPIYDDKTFVNQIFTQEELRNCEFDNCTFTNCDLSGVEYLSGTYIDCRFSNCNLSMVKMNHCQLNNVCFTGCKLLGASFFDCNDTLFNVSFEECLMEYTVFTAKKMIKTPFVRCVLRNADFSDCDLTKARFADCDLASAVFQHTVLKEADFTTAYNYTIDPESNTLRKARFSLQGAPGLLVKYGIVIE